MQNLNLKRIDSILSGFHKQRIAVIGDLMLDRYIFGKVERISPEAPVPVVNVTHEKKVPGGAANVALNLVMMQAECSLGGAIGNDSAGDELLNLLAAQNIHTKMVYRNHRKPTTLKVRIFGHSQNLLRIDYEDTCYLDKEQADELFKMISDSIQAKFAIISDYSKGTMTPELIRSLIIWANDHQVNLIVDPKPAHKEFYKNCYLITPNKKEAQEMTGIIINDEASLNLCGEKLMNELRCKVIITLGEEGMAVFGGETNIHRIPTRAKEVYDVSGAGDTVMAALTLALSCGANLTEAAEIANCAAGIKVSKVGTQPVSLSEIRNFLKIKK